MERAASSYGWNALAVRTSDRQHAAVNAVVAAAFSTCMSSTCHCVVLCCLSEKGVVVAPECMAVAPGKIPGTGGAQHVGPIRGTRKRCLILIGRAMSQQFPGKNPGKLPGDFLRTPSANLKNPKNGASWCAQLEQEIGG